MQSVVGVEVRANAVEIGDRVWSRTLGGEWLWDRVVGVSIELDDTWLLFLEYSLPQALVEDDMVEVQAYVD